MLAARITKQSPMNTNTESIHAVKQDNARVPKLIASSAAAKLGMALVVVSLLLTIPCARAQTKLSTGDNDFILAAAQRGMTEVKLSELASDRGMRDGVKEVGHLMAKDHTAINVDLKALATQKGVILSSRLDAKHQEMVDKVAALADSDFDDAYTAVMLKVLKTEARKFKAESEGTQDADIKSFVDKSTPIVVEYLMRITAMQR